MKEEDVDNSRRHFLTIAASAAGAVGAVGVAVPFLSSMKPSARAQALGAPVEVSVGSMEPGEMARVVWRGKVVYVLRRSEDMLDRLASNVDQLRDPASAESEQPEYTGERTPDLSNLNSWSSRASARTSVAPRCRILKFVRRRTGTAASSARATAPSSISPAVCSRACLRRPTCACRRIDSSGTT